MLPIRKPLKNKMSCVTKYWNKIYICLNMIKVFHDNALVAQSIVSCRTVGV